jgi:hypothetical protein
LFANFETTNITESGCGLFKNRQSLQPDSSYRASLHYLLQSYEEFSLISTNKASGVDPRVVQHSCGDEH